MGYKFGPGTQRDGHSATLGIGLMGGARARQGLGTTHSNSIEAVARKPKSASRTGDPPPRISDFPLSGSGGAMLAEKTKRGRSADVASCREEIGFGLRMGDGSPFRIISLSLCSTPFNAK